MPKRSNMNVPSKHKPGAAGASRAAGAAGVGLLLAALVSGGCAQRGRIELVSLDFRNIDPPAPHVVTLRAAECCWWVDERGDLWVAMHREQHVPWRPRLRFELDMSLRLAAPPAGRARNYRLDRDSLRLRIEVGPWQLRFSSMAGIAAVYHESGKRLRGSVRARTRRVTSQLLGGWSKPTGYLLMASFTAVPDAERGRAIADRTEADGWDRKPPRRSTALRGPASPRSPTAAPGEVVGTARRAAGGKSTSQAMRSTAQHGRCPPDDRA